MSEPEPQSESEKEPQPSTSTGRGTSDHKKDFYESKEPRGFAKHAVLKSYLDAWFPIMLRTFRQLVYVDGFAGPGKYQDPEMDKEDRLGSPILVYKALAQHTNMRDKEGTVFLIFFEANKDFYEKLKENLEQAKQDYPIQHNVKIETEVYHGDFNKLMNEVLLRFTGSPMFVFADPFGYNMKMCTLQNILSSHGWSSPRELFLTLMDGRLLAFIDDQRKHKSQDELLGVSPSDDPDDDWREKCKGATREEKLNILCEFYTRRLQEGHRDEKFSEFAYPVHNLPEPGEEQNYVLKFAMRDHNNRHIYHLIYVTHHMKGLKEMKCNMSRKSQDLKSFQFSEWVSEKNVRMIRDIKFEKEEIAKDIVQRLIQEFSLPDQENKTTGKEIESFVQRETPYAFNVKVQVRKPMRDAGITGEPQRGKFEMKTFTFPKTSDISTSEQQQQQKQQSQLNPEPTPAPVASSSSSARESPPKKKRKREKSIVQNDKC